MHAMISKWSAKMAPFTPFVLRVVVGIVFLVAGWQKMQMGNTAVAGFFAAGGIPAASFFAFLVTWIEILGGIAVILGFWTKLWAKVLSFIMLVAVIVTAANGGGFTGATGYELPLIMFAATFTLFCIGGGRWSIDRS